MINPIDILAHANHLMRCRGGTTDARNTCLLCKAEPGEICRLENPDPTCPTCGTPSVDGCYACSFQTAPPNSQDCILLTMGDQSQETKQALRDLHDLIQAHQPELKQDPNWGPYMKRAEQLLEIPRKAQTLEDLDPISEKEVKEIHERIKALAQNHQLPYQYAERVIMRHLKKEAETELLRRLNTIFNSPDGQQLVRNVAKHPLVRALFSPTPQ